MKRLNCRRHRMPRHRTIRMSRIRQIRAAIRAGHYDNESRLSVAIDRMMERVLRLPVGDQTAAQ